MSANIDECIQDSLLSLRNEVQTFQSTDNFDDSQINVYLERVLDLTAQMFRNTPRNIFDITAIFDTLFYLVNAQVLF
jgi:hypothetical protein